MRRITFSKRLTTALAMGLLALLITAVPTLAGVTWCRADPIVRLNGADVQIWVAVPEQYAPLVNGPIDVRIAIPREVTRQVILLDAGFNGHGETVSFSDKGRVQSSGQFNANIQVQVPVDVSSPDQAVNIPVQVEVVQNGVSQWFTGNANSTFFTATVQGVQ